MEVESGLMGKDSVWPLMTVVMDEAFAAPSGLLTVMVFPFRPVKVWPSMTVLESMSMPGMTRLAKVEADREGVKRPLNWRTDMASLVRENTVEIAEGVARKLDRALEAGEAPLLAAETISLAKEEIFEGRDLIRATMLDSAGRLGG